MNNTREIDIAYACERVINKSIVAFDAGNYEGFANLFSLNGRWIRTGPAEIKGRDEIARFLGSRPKAALIRHISSNAVITVESESSAKGISYATVYRDPNCTDGSVGILSLPVMIVEYHDTFVRSDEGWLIDQRLTKLIFQSR